VPPGPAACARRDRTWQDAASAAVCARSLTTHPPSRPLRAAGWFTPRAEFTNGRAAMIGWAVLLWLESKAGVPFF
jgi:hypothetical protein